MYDYQEFPYLADRIEQIFESDDLCLSFSSNAMKKASDAHNRKKNMTDYLQMYEDIVGSKE